MSLPTWIDFNSITWITEGKLISRPLMENESPLLLPREIRNDSIVIKRQTVTVLFVAVLGDCQAPSRCRWCEQCCVSSWVSSRLWAHLRLRASQGWVVMWRKTRPREMKRVCPR